jgi:hypothetical protein
VAFRERPGDDEPACHAGGAEDGELHESLPWRAHRRGGITNMLTVYTLTSRVDAVNIDA